MPPQTSACTQNFPRVEQGLHHGVRSPYSRGSTWLNGICAGKPLSMQSACSTPEPEDTACECERHREPLVFLLLLWPVYYTTREVTGEGVGGDLGSVPLPTVPLRIVITRRLLELDVGQHVPHGCHQPVHPLVQVLPCARLLCASSSDFSL